MRTLLLSALAAYNFAVGTAIGAGENGTLTPETEQIVFMVDTSESMNESAFGFWGWISGKSRWELVTEAFPTWLERVDVNAALGATSVGGECGGGPIINLPVDADRSRLVGITDDVRPNGNTPLNASLLSSPDLFRNLDHTKKRIVLFSDGLNTCEPRRDTCEIAKWLYQHHGITIDVVALVTDPDMADQFQCVAAVTGGTFWSAEDTGDWMALPLPSIWVWALFLGALFLLGIIVAGLCVYRRLFRGFFCSRLMLQAFGPDVGGKLISEVSMAEGRKSAAKTYWLVPKIESVYHEEEKSLQERLDPAKQGLDDATSGIPSANAKKFGDSEQNITTQCLGSIHQLEQYTKKQLEKLAIELQGRSLETIGRNIEDSRNDSERKINTELENAKHELEPLKLDKSRFSQQLLRFRKRNDLLHREADYPDSKILPISLLIVVMFGESFLNMYFFAQGHGLGLIGGLMQASLVAAVNVVISCMAGYFALQNLFYVTTELSKTARRRVLVRRIFSGLGLLIYAVVGFMFHLGVGHYRGLLEVDPDNADRLAVERLFHQPFDITSFDAIILVLLGIAAGLIAFFDGYKWISDTYPGYEDLDRKYRDADEDYHERKGRVRSDLEDLLSNGIVIIDQFLKDAEKKMEDSKSLIAEKNTYLTTFDQSADQIQRIYFRALATYREANVGQRDSSSSPPKYFESRELDLNLYTTSDTNKWGKAPSEMEQELDVAWRKLGAKASTEKQKLRNSGGKIIENLPKWFETFENTPAPDPADPGDGLATV